ncbi:MAG: FAD-dependent thymidylate synthase [Epsilonproteobacteria bacterium]|nr:FAD-dependent thymidylate synthase [Campylobacterota bacterium]
MLSYKKPKVTLLQESGLGVAEIAARTCYDSFENSENDCIRNYKEDFDRDAINSIEDSELLANLAWVHHHHSILEHATLSFLVEGISRGVLQEHARHRIQAISCRSTRYTMSSVLNAFAASMKCTNELVFFINKIMELDMFVVDEEEYLFLEIECLFNKLKYHRHKYEEDSDFLKEIIAASSLGYMDELGDNPEALYQALQNGKRKRNVGDKFKHIVTDNWKVDMVVTFNIRSLKNYFDLRDSGAAWFQIQWLAQAIKEATPMKYLKLIDKKYKDI